MEAAEVFLTGKAIRSCYRVIARDGHVVWFQCEAKVMLHEDGRPWFIHGIAFAPHFTRAGSVRNRMRPR